MSGQRAAESFKEELREILKGLGFTWQDQLVHDMAEARRGCEYLCCRANNLTGWLDVASLLAIREALKKAKTFKLTVAETFAQVLENRHESSASGQVGKFADVLMVGNGEKIVVSPFVDRAHSGPSEACAGRAA